MERVIQNFKKRKYRWIRWGVFAVLFLSILMNLLVFSTATLESPDSFITEIDVSELLNFAGPEATQVPGIPKNRVPDYTIDDFDLVSTKKGARQWQILARKAYVYKTENLMHGMSVQAFVYDQQGKITILKGRECKYQIESNDLEVFGDVETTLPDGFVITSPYLKYTRATETLEVPVTDEAQGYGIEPSGEKLSFKSLGLRYLDSDRKIYLLKNVYTWVQGKDQKEPSLIRSDHVMIDRTAQRAVYTMNPSRPFSEQFTTVENSTIFVKSRTLELIYGKNRSSQKTEIQFLTAYDDVTIQEKTEAGNLNYATAGKAEFDTRLNKMILTRFPQVYQNKDTVIGDKITIYRDQDIVEVENSNAYSEGKPQTQAPSSAATESLQGTQSR